MRVDFYGQIKEEAGVVMAFSILHKELGFPKLVPSSATGFDIDDIEYKNGQRVTVEFEYTSDNFIRHGHVDKMLVGRKYVLICYEDNCNILQTIRNKYKKTNLEVIELKNFIVTKEEKIIDNQSAIEYIVLNYNPKYADNRRIGDWSKSNLYRLKSKFKDNYIAPGSKVLFKQGDYIVGRCEVVRYELFEKPTNENEWKIYHSLTNYPIGLFNDTMDETKQDFIKGHIFYDEFEVFNDRKVSFKDKLPNKKMDLNGMIKISKEEYDRLLGN